MTDLVTNIAVFSKTVDDSLSINIKENYSKFSFTIFNNIDILRQFLSSSFCTIVILDIDVYLTVKTDPDVLKNIHVILISTTTLDDQALLSFYNIGISEIYSADDIQQNNNLIIFAITKIIAKNPKFIDKRFEFFFNNTPSYMLISDFDLSILQRNDIFHQTFDNAVNNFVDFIPLRFQQEFIDQLNDAIVQTRSHFLFSTYFIFTLSSISKLNWMAEIDYDTNIISFISINNLQSQNTSLLINRNFSLTTNAIRLIDSDFTVIHHNVPYAKLLGLAPDTSLIGKKCYEISNNYKCKTAKCPVAIVRRQQKNIVYETIVNSAERGDINCITSVSPLHGTDGTLLGIIDEYRDVTSLKKTEKELKLHKALLEKIFQTTPSGIAVLLKGIIQSTNKEVTVITGYDQNELLQAHPSFLFASKSEYKKVANYTIEKLKQGSQGTITTIWKHKKGKVLDILINLSAMDANNISDGQIYTITDISSLKQKEAELKRAKKQLEFKNQIAASFLLSSKRSILQNPLKYILKEFSSTFAYIGLINTQDALEYAPCHSMHDTIDNSTNKLVLKRKDWTGEYGESLLEEKPLLNNSGLTIPHTDFIIDRAIAAPIFAKDRMIGHIFLANKNNPYTLQDLEDLEKLIEYLAPIIQSIREEQIVKVREKKTETKLERELLHNKALAKISDFLISANLSFKEISQFILHQTIAITGAKYGIITSFIEKNYEPVYIYSNQSFFDNLKEQNLLKQIIPHSPMGEIDLFGKKKYYSDSIKNRSKLHDVGISNYLSVPAQIGEHLLGNICVFNSAYHHSNSHVATIKKISEFFAISLQRISLSNELKILNAELEERVNFRTSQLQATTEELEIAKTRLEEKLDTEKELNDLKSRFVKNISHEYRTPLSVIRSSADLINISLMNQKYDTVFKNINNIISYVDSMTKLLDDVLFYENTKTKSLRPATHEVNLHKLISESVKYAKEKTSTQHNFFIQDSTICPTIYTNAELLYQILKHIISNAIKYSPDDSSIEISIDENSRFVIIKITDAGIGIPSNETNHLFEPFHRFSNVGVIQGTGLGLSIVKQCINQLNGLLKVESEVEKGTTISIMLPKQ